MICHRRVQQETRWKEQPIQRLYRADLMHHLRVVRFLHQVRQLRLQQQLMPRYHLYLRKQQRHGILYRIRTEQLTRLKQVHQCLQAQHHLMLSRVEHIISILMALRHTYMILLTHMRRRATTRKYP